KDELIQFLDNVCVPEVMDVSFDVFSSSRAILEERVNICALLSTLDPEHGDRYADELKAITKYQAIQDGLRDVDSSRVHVNLEAVARWAEKQFKESFDRYKDLLRSRVGFSSSEDFENAIQTFSKEAISKGEELRYPEQEGDALLIEVFDAIKS